MIKFLLSLLSENGTVSMTRFLSLVCVLTSSLLAILGLYSTVHSLESVALLCGTFLTTGLGAKVMQKKYETSSVEVSQKENGD